MSDEGAPKSAFELAMEKLKARGNYEERKLTGEQKAAIADIRSRYRARVAEAEIQHQSRLASVTTYEELDKMKTELAREKERLNAEMEEKVEEVRSAS
jgi:Spy/CpxP family protein refolding chaperone